MENNDGDVTLRKICAISDDVCRKICTGQVVITLSGACKELIDNSLDAGAKTIGSTLCTAEVRLKKMGFESIEVIDDGYGIHSINFDSLCKPHATSKLSNFSDFNQLTTFGFRGEALSSLCAVSSVTITTRHTNEVMATKLQFDHDASIKLQEKCARPIGTTVLIRNLFETLPVRRKEFERSLKKAFAKLLITVQSFCLSHTDVRFVLNSLTDGKQYKALVTPGGNASVKDVLVNLFGLRFEKDSVLDIIQCEPDELIRSQYGISSQCKFDDIRISGYVSSCVHGQGRSTADRQFIYFNKRPVDYAKLCRIANEVYQLYNRGQYCMLILFVDVPAETMDVNVAPDKRSVFFVHEKELFALLRASLIATFTPYLGLIGTSSSSLRTESLLRIDDSFAQLTQPDDIDDSFDVSAQSFQLSFEPAIKIGPPTVISSDAPCSSADIMSKDDAHVIPRKRPVPIKLQEDSATVSKRQSKNLFEKFALTVIPHSPHLPKSSINKKDEISNALSPLSSRDKSLQSVVESTSKSDDIDMVLHEDADFPEMSEDDDDDDDDDNGNGNGNGEIMDENHSKYESQVEVYDNKPTVTENASNALPHRSQQTISFSMSRLKKLIDEKTSEAEANISNSDEETELCGEFKISCQEVAENELATYISKEDFQSMQIVGQFNKGFIIARLHNNLFIIDQHASDEKYNFERFQKKARIQTQHLISPRILDLGVIKEAILRDNIDIFKYNGFEFRFDDDEVVGKRALLTAIPVLHSWQFSISDIDEMLSVLCDFPGIIYRPVKLQKIFASRACRKSVMIGSSLTFPQMEKIVRHLGSLDHPWNCPHGRPTLRHLCALKTKISRSNLKS